MITNLMFWLGLAGGLNVLKNPAQPPIKNESLAEIKCKEYSALVYENQNSLLTDKCGIPKRAVRTGGEYTVPTEFPHMALIGFESKSLNKTVWSCTGSLISDQHVLVPAACVFFNNVKYVRLGDFNKDETKPNPEREEFEIVKILNPEYTSKLIYNDIAVLKLDRKVTLNAYRRPACLPTSMDGGSKGKFIESGWPYDRDNMQKIRLEQVSAEKCNQTLGYIPKMPDGIVEDTQICAGSDTEVSCLLPGAALQVYHESEYCMYTIVGIASFGDTCSLSHPGVFTRVYLYVKFIEDVLWR